MVNISIFLTAQYSVALHWWLCNGPLSVIMADIFMVKIEKWCCDIWEAFLLQTLCGWYYLSTWNQRTRRNFRWSYTYHPKTNFTIEVNPTEYLDTNIHLNQGGEQETVQKANSLVINTNSDKKELRSFF